MTDTEALVVLNMIEGLGPVKTGRLAEAFSTPAAALEASVADLKRVKGIGREIAARIARWDSEIDLAAELEAAAREGAGIITIMDEAYPSLLREIYDPPPVLYVKGEILPEDGCAVAVILGSPVTAANSREIGATIDSG